MDNAATFPGRAIKRQATMNGLLNVYTIVNAYMTADTVVAELSASWCSAQLKRRGVDQVILDIMAHANGVDDTCVVTMLRPETADDHGVTMHVTVPTNYLTAEDGDERLLEILHARATLAVNAVTAAIVCADVEQVLASANATWWSARVYAIGVAMLSGQQ